MRKLKYISVSFLLKYQCQNVCSCPCILKLLHVIIKIKKKQNGACNRAARARRPSRKMAAAAARPPCFDRR